jgi:hypothetical protein
MELGNELPFRRLPENLILQNANWEGKHPARQTSWELSTRYHPVIIEFIAE